MFMMVIKGWSVQNAQRFARYLCTSMYSLINTNLASFINQCNRHIIPISFQKHTLSHSHETSNGAGSRGMQCCAYVAHARLAQKAQFQTP